MNMLMLLINMASLILLANCIISGSNDTGIIGIQGYNEIETTRHFVSLRRLL